MTDLFKTRTFWLALITLVMLILGVFIQGYTLDVESAVGMAVIAAVYLISYSLNPSGEGLAAMLMSRKFWAAVLGFLVLFLDSFHVFPNSLNVEATVGFVVLISGYMICLAIDPGNGWRKLLVSRKFWAAMIGLAVTLLQAFNIALPQGITTDSLLAITLLITGLIAAYGAQGKPEEFPDPVLPEG